MITAGSSGPAPAAVGSQSSAICSKRPFHNRRYRSSHSSCARRGSMIALRLVGGLAIYSRSFIGVVGSHAF